MDSNQTALVNSVAAKFEPKLPDGCSEELAQHLRRNRAYWNDLSPKRMETLVADIFRANYRHSEVIHVGRPGDKGIDIVFIDSGTKWLIQVKRRAHASKAEGFASLQSVLGMLVLEGERHGIIVSTADSFSHQARKAQHRARERGYVVELYDQRILDRMIGALLPQVPWREIFAHPSLQHVGDDVKRHFWGAEFEGQLTLF